MCIGDQHQLVRVFAELRAVYLRISVKRCTHIARMVGGVPSMRGLY